jgi:hypothetical protein
MICTNCKSYRVRRIKREGFFRIKLAPLFGFYPWRCSNCGTVQMLKMRGGPMRKRSAGNPPGEPEAFSEPTTPRTS